MVLEAQKLRNHVFYVGFVHFVLENRTSGASGGGLEDVWEALGRTWRRCGASSGTPGVSLGRPGVLLVTPGQASLTAPGHLVGPFWRLLENCWDPLDSPCGGT